MHTVLYRAIRLTGGASQPSELEKFYTPGSLIAAVRATPTLPHACAMAHRIKVSQPVGKAHVYCTILIVLLTSSITLTSSALVFRKAELPYLKTFGEKIYIGNLLFKNMNILIRLYRILNILDVAITL